MSNVYTIVCILTTVHLQDCVARIFDVEIFRSRISYFMTGNFENFKNPCMYLQHIKLTIDEMCLDWL